MVSKALIRISTMTVVIVWPANVLSARVTIHTILLHMHGSLALYILLAASGR